MILIGNKSDKSNKHCSLTKDLPQISCFFPDFLIVCLQENWGLKMPNEILTLKELAEYLKLTEKTAYRLAAEGKLPGFKVGGSWRFKLADIEAWIEIKKTKNKEI